MNYGKVNVLAVCVSVGVDCIVCECCVVSVFAEDAGDLCVHELRVCIHAQECRRVVCILLSWLCICVNSFIFDYIHHIYTHTHT